MSRIVLHTISNMMKFSKGPEVTKYSGDKKEFIEDIRKALYASKIVSYAQGFMLLREAANVFKWKLNYGGIGKERDKDTLSPPFFVKFLQYATK